MQEGRKYSLIEKAIKKAHFKQQYELEIETITFFYWMN